MNARESKGGTLLWALLMVAGLLIGPPMGRAEESSADEFEFRIEGDAPSWRPLKVYVEGDKTYIVSGRQWSHENAPILLALGPRGEVQKVEYRITGHRLVVDQILSKAALVSGAGQRRRKIQIERQQGANALVTGAEAAMLAEEVTKFLVEREPPAKTMLVLEHSKASTLFAEELEAALQRAGYAVALPTSGVIGLLLRYQISGLDGGILLRLKWRGLEVSRWYVRGQGEQLTAATPFAVGGSEEDLSEVRTELGRMEVMP